MNENEQRQWDAIRRLMLAVEELANAMQSALHTASLEVIQTELTAVNRMVEASHA